MSLMERETTKKTIFSAKTVACTIVYSDGSTLLNPKSNCTENSRHDNDNGEDRLRMVMLSLLTLMTPMFTTLQENNLWELFSKVEMKIVPILVEKMRRLEEDGNKILFGELQLDKNIEKKVARTQINNYKSTSENVLRKLQDFHPLPKIVLEYRSVTKVKSAYVDGILNFVHNGTLHTSWIFYDNKSLFSGKEFETTLIVPRKAFKSREGWSFISSDFQSIELRLLTHFSKDPSLLRIFNECSSDVFVHLAATWLSVNPDSVKSVDRERAKRVVYSVVYGVGKERLADTLNVSAEEAKSFTTSFLGTIRPIHILCQLKLCSFKTAFKHAKDKVDFKRNFVLSHTFSFDPLGGDSHLFHPGYVTTIFGRRRFLPFINSNNAQLRLQSERQAVNFVIQGSAADICKMGMISIANALERKDLKIKARLLVQIHDELVIEVLDECLHDVKGMLFYCLVKIV
ncbi:DNA polymerase nu-like [Xenia sp. Carnegie-2017]|uniref:DNA polymerase nu-like n=1 Tax=Xenia sp. Carnegie-2017 TaxID=2897299 RepID=UPI001F0469B6|nr:DNA polymerase nu-like [Xenia sp. Carnegie-2017]